MTDHHHPAAILRGKIFGMHASCRNCTFKHKSDRPWCEKHPADPFPENQTYYNQSCELWTPTTARQT